MALRAAFVLAAIAVLMAPTAAAHTTVYSADGKVRASVGLLAEPVSTYAVTGLDVCFTQNTTGTPRPAVNVANAGALAATLTAPNGDVHEADLEVPFGRANCVTFADPMVLTQPGQYFVHLTGSINGTTFDRAGIKAGGVVVDRGNITFPDAAVPSELQLQQRISALESRIQALEAEQAAAAAKDKDGEFAPGAPAALLVLGLVGLAALRRRS